MDIFEEAKQKVDLLQFLRGYGFHLKVYPSGARGNRCPSCGPSRDPHSTRLYVGRGEDGHWFWFCHVCGETGDVIKAAQLLEGLSAPKEAAEWLLGETKLPVSRPACRGQSGRQARLTVASKEELSKVNKKRLQVIEGLVASIACERGSRKKIWDYLIETRRIPEQVLREVIRRKLVYLLPDDPFTLNQAMLRRFDTFLLKEAELLTKKGSIKPLILSRPIVSPFFSHRKLIGAEFRGLGDTQPKTITLVKSGLWWWRGEENSVCVVEGIIDLMSLLAMGWHGSILAMPGTGMARKVIEILKEPLKGMDVTIALDGDGAGYEALEKIYFGIPQLARVLDIPDGKDLNDLLKEGVRDWRMLLTEEERRNAVC